jgi:hypothetical protein
LHYTSNAYAPKGKQSLDNFLLLCYYLTILRTLEWEPLMSQPIILGPSGPAEELDPRPSTPQWRRWVWYVFVAAAAVAATIVAVHQNRNDKMPVDKVSLVREPWEYTNQCDNGLAQWQAAIVIGRRSREYDGDGLVYHPQSGVMLIHPPVPVTLPHYHLNFHRDTDGFVVLNIITADNQPVGMLVTFSDDTGRVVRKWDAPLIHDSPMDYSQVGMNYTFDPSEMVEEILPGEHIKSLQLCWGTRAH